MFHARLYAAAEFFGKHDKFRALFNLTPFGCGVDAVNN